MPVGTDRPGGVDPARRAAAGVGCRRVGREVPLVVGDDPPLGCPGRGRARAVDLRAPATPRPRRTPTPTRSSCCPTASIRGRLADPCVDRGRGAQPGSGSPGPFVLYPAITYPHKNHVMLIEAFARLHASHPGRRARADGRRGPGRAGGRRPPSSVAVSDGSSGAWAESREPSSTGCSPRRRRSPTPPATRASALPVLEALSAGTPGRGRDAASMPEVRRRCRPARRPRRRRGVGEPRSTGAATTTRAVADLVERGLTRAAGQRMGQARARARRRLPPHRVRVAIGWRPMRILVLCPHFAPDVAPTGRGDDEHRRGARRARPPPARRHLAALVRAPRVELGLARVDRCTTPTSRGVASPGCTRSPPTSEPRRPGRSASAASPVLAALEGAITRTRPDVVLAMSPPLTLGPAGRGGRPAPAGPVRVQHPGRVPRRRRRARACSPTPR